MGNDSKSIESMYTLKSSLLTIHVNVPLLLLLLVTQFLPLLLHTQRSALEGLAILSGAQKEPVYVENWTPNFRRRFTRHLDVPWTSSRDKAFTERPSNVAVLAGWVETVNITSSTHLFKTSVPPSCLNMSMLALRCPSINLFYTSKVAR